MTSATTAAEAIAKEATFLNKKKIENSDTETDNDNDNDSDTEGIYQGEDEEENPIIIPRKRTLNGRLKAIPFPNKLMKVLAIKENHHAIAWMPDGKAFVVLQPKVFAQEVLPKYFHKCCQYNSFSRKLRRWGFRALEKRIFTHEKFVRGRVDLVDLMSVVDTERQGAAEEPRKVEDDHSSDFDSQPPHNDQWKTTQRKHKALVAGSVVHSHVRSESQKPKNKTNQEQEHLFCSQDDSRVPKKAKMSDKVSPHHRRLLPSTRPTKRPAPIPEAQLSSSIILRGQHSYDTTTTSTMIPPRVILAAPPSVEEGPVPDINVKRFNDCNEAAARTRAALASMMQQKQPGSLLQGGSCGHNNPRQQHLLNATEEQQGSASPPPPPPMETAPIRTPSAAGIPSASSSASSSLELQEKRERFDWQAQRLLNRTKHNLSTLPRPLGTAVVRITPGGVPSASSLDLIENRESHFHEFLEERELAFVELWEERERMFLQVLNDDNNNRGRRPLPMIEELMNRRRQEMEHSMMMMEMTMYRRQQAGRSSSMSTAASTSSWMMEDAERRRRQQQQHHQQLMAQQEEQLMMEEALRRRRQQQQLLMAQQEEEQLMRETEERRRRQRQLEEQKHQLLMAQEEEERRRRLRELDMLEERREILMRQYYAHHSNPNRMI